MALNRLLLADKSALERATPEMLELGEICLCAIVRLELLYSARSPDDYADIEEKLASFRDLRVDAETILTAVTAHRELGRQGRHRLPISDLLIAACAQQHQAAVLHVDRHYDVLAEVLDFEPVRLASAVSERAEELRRDRRPRLATFRADVGIAKAAEQDGPEARPFRTA